MENLAALRETDCARRHRAHAIRLRITKETSKSAERTQVRLNHLRVRLHFPEDTYQGSQEVIPAAEKTVMRSVSAGMLPESFGGVEFRGVGRQLMHLQPMTVGLEPSPDLRIFMIGGIILNQHRPWTAIAPGELFEEAQISRGIEDRLLTIVEPGSPEFDGSKDFYILALAGDRNFHRTAHTAPGGVQRGILPETGFIGEEQRPVPRWRFF